MPTYLWSGKTASGEEEAEDVVAETALEARKILEARGWTELRQHTTGLHDLVTRDPSRAAKFRRPTPKERVQHHEGTAPGFFRRWLKHIAASGSAIILIVACLALGLQQWHRTGNSAGTVFYLILLGAVLLLYPVLHWWYGRTKRLYVKLLKAKKWHRWDEMLRCLDKIEKSKRATKIGLSDFLMARYRAMAMAGKGRVEEAVNYYRAAADKAQATPSQYYLLLAGIYSVAKRYDMALECYRLALQEAADKSMACISMGMVLAQRFNRVVEARELLAQAEGAQLSELERAFVWKLRGVIAFKEKDYAAMDRNFRETIAAYERKGPKKAYIYEGSLMICQGYLAVSSAALGRMDEARRYHEASKEYLKLIELTEVLAAYEALAGGR